MNSKSTSPDYKLIASIRKNAREEFRIAICTFKNFRGFELRVFQQNGQGEFIATPRGLAMRAEALPDIIAALQAASGEVAQ